MYSDISGIGIRVADTGNQLYLNKIMDLLFYLYNTFQS